jgi:Mg-chelatase subunit ChlD
MAKKKATGATNEVKRGRGRPKGAKNKPKKTTRVVLVVDRSGSMSSVRQAAFDGVNEQIATIKRNAKLTGKTYTTYIQFDDVVEIVFENKEATELVPITFDQYVPRGSTALRDATFTAIKSLQHVGAKDGEDTGYLVVVISDGGENASKDITADALKTEITTLEATGKWTFTYMLSNVDAQTVGQSLGVSAYNVASFTSNAAGTQQAFSQMSSSYHSYATLRSSGVKGSTTFYKPTTTDGSSS